jgi:hypothetical protein
MVAKAKRRSKHVKDPLSEVAKHALVINQTQDQQHK